MPPSPSPLASCPSIRVREWADIAFPWIRITWSGRRANSISIPISSLAGEINRRMPEFVREKAHRDLNRLGVAPSRSKILILGVSYKKDLGDCRESPAIEVIRLMEKDGAEVVYHDPHVPEFEEHGIGMASVPLTEELLAEANLVIITANHSCIDYPWVVSKAQHVLDTRNATKEVTKHRDKITLL